MKLRIQSSPFVVRLFQSTNNFIKKKDAFEHGRAAAQRDAKAGHFRILSFGKAQEPREVDPETGYLVEQVAPLDLRLAAFEQAGYNKVMRRWHAKQLRYPRSNQSPVQLIVD